MANMCTICSNENIRKINAAIVKGTKLNTIVSKFDVSYSALRRHRTHCLEIDISDKIDVTALLEECLEISLGSAVEARSDKVYNAVGSIMSGPYKAIEILSKVDDSNDKPSGLSEMRLELQKMRAKPEST